PRRGREFVGEVDIGPLLARPAGLPVARLVELSEVNAQPDPGDDDRGKQHEEERLQPTRPTGESAVNGFAVWRVGGEVEGRGLRGRCGDGRPEGELHSAPRTTQNHALRHLRRVELVRAT